ncbi:golgin subfamily A member 4 [Gastrophryne carolinensis]
MSGHPRPTGNRSRSSSMTDQQDDAAATPDKELLAGMLAEPALLSEYTIFALDHTKRSKPQSGSVNASRSSDSINGNDPSSSLRSESQSFAQKLQLRVPSMESLFRSPVKETLFRSPSKESLVRSGSRESLNRIETDSTGPVFDPSSDIESEAEDSVSSLEGLSKDQLLHRLRRMEKSLGNYRGKYSELVTAYRTVQRDKEKLQTILSQSQDKALRRIGELREEIQMDQQAKKHLQEEFDASLEEKDQLISVLQTQVSLLKQRLGNVQVDTEMATTQLEPQNLTAGQEGEADSSASLDGSDDSAKTLEALQVRVRRQENLLQRCKEMIRSHKERSAQLCSEKDALQNQLEERLQELEKIKDLHSGEKTKLITQLRDAKNLVEQLEQDKGMVIAETKRQMHETLMKNEEEVSQLRTRVKQLSTRCEKLQEEKEKSEKAAFEQLEKAVTASQNSEEAHKTGKLEMEEQIKAIEKASEEERVNLQKELSRVKQEVVDIMKKTSEERIQNLEKSHAETMQKKEQEYKESLRILEERFQEKLKSSLAKTQEEQLVTLQEKEQQALLALEEMELQKKAIQTQTENQLQEMQQELEECRTRILELESFLAKTSQDSEIKTEEMTTRIECETNKHNEEIAALIEKHKKELELQSQQNEQVLLDKLDGLKQENMSNITELKEKFQKEYDLQLKEREQMFQAHIKEMNEKTLEKLDVKQTELEAISSELSEALKLRQEIEQKLLECQNEVDVMKKDHKEQLDDVEKRHQLRIDDLEKEKDILTQGVEKDLKQEINHLKLLIDGKDREVENLLAEKQQLAAALANTKAEFETVSTQLNELKFSQQRKIQEDAEFYETHSTELQEKLKTLTQENTSLKDLLEERELKCNSLTIEFEAAKEQVQSLLLQIKEQNIRTNEELNSLKLRSDAEVNECKNQVDHISKIISEKENEILRLSETHNKVISELNQNLAVKEKKLISLQEELEAKNKSQENKIQKMKQRIKDLQEVCKRKCSELESKMKEELEKKQLELCNKEKQFNEKMLEMAQASSMGINEALSQLEQNHKEQIQSMSETHQQMMAETNQAWEKKLSHQLDELKEKHEVERQEKEQELTEINNQFTNVSREKEQATQQLSQLTEEKNKLDASVKELQELLNHTSAQVLSLTDSENHLKSQLEALRNEYTAEVNEKKTLVEGGNSLKAIIEENKSTIDGLLVKLQEAEQKVLALETCQNTESVELKKEMADKVFEKESQCRQLLFDQRQKFELHFKESVLLLESLTTMVTIKYNDQMTRLISRIARCEKMILNLKETVSKQITSINELEALLEQNSKEFSSVNCLLSHTTQQLQEKENVNLSLKDELNVLIAEKETLQKEGGNQQKAADEKESCITQLRKELSENINTVTSLTAALKDRDVEINELKLKLENSVDLEEKEKALAFLNSQHDECKRQLQKQIQDLTSKVEQLSQAKSISEEELNKIRNKFEEWKKKAEVKFTQNHQTIRELEENNKMSNKQIMEKEEQIKKITEDLTHHQSEKKKELVKMETMELELRSTLGSYVSQIEELKAEVTKLTNENLVLKQDIDRQYQQQSVEKSEFVSQLEHIKNVASEKDSVSMEAQQQIVTLKEEISILKDDFHKKILNLEGLQAELTESKDKALEDKLAAESAKKIADLKKKAEQRIASVKRQLTSQLEEKEKSKQDLELQLNELREQFQKQVGLQLENEEHVKKYSLLLEQQSSHESKLATLGEELTLKEQKIMELEDTLDDVQQKLHKAEESLREKGHSVVKEMEAEKLKCEQLSSKHQEILLSLQGQLNAKDLELKVCMEKMEENLRLYEESQALFNEMKSQENTLAVKLQEAESEIQKLRKEVTKLQKDMRSLRKEHNQELDLLKKELSEEAEQRIKHEQEDLELKHNSTLKQLMREFNTQLAQKERELETAVQETICKAQEVEAELMQSHKIKSTQLYKKIAEKEDDLKRTVKKYEELLEAREEEMTLKVTELQEQLEQLQEDLSKRQADEFVQDGEVQTFEQLQAQMAKKTSQLNEAKLNMQEFKEKINVLEDQLKQYTQGVFVSPLGTPYKEDNHRHTDVSVFGEPTEFEYLRKVMFEYMMGRETKTMAKVITTVLRFPADQAQKILEREDARPGFTSPRSGIF